MKIHDLAAEILKSRVTPEYIEREIRHLMRGQGGASWTRKS
jgi:hypothetical protein